MKNKKILILIALVLMISLVGITYAFFEYYGVSADYVVSAGEVTLTFNEGTDTIDLTNIFPETKEEARDRDDNVITFTVSGVNTTENKDIWYEIMLNEGDEETGLTRFLPKELMFDLTEINPDGTKNLVVDNMNFSEFDDTRIWVNTILKENESTFTRTYELRMWLSDKVLISDTVEGADYTTSEFRQRYASVRVSVFGDFNEKKMPVYLAKEIETSLSTYLQAADTEGNRYLASSTTDNYVWYSGKLWRIVSINSDGTIKLVTQGNMTAIAWDIDRTNTVYENSQIHNWLKNEFLPTLANADTLLADSVWDYTTYADATATKASLTAYVENEKVGLLTIYDYYKAGSSSSFLKNGYRWWTMSPRTDGSYVWLVSDSGTASYDSLTGGGGVRPSVNLKSDIQIMGGSGTKSNPYVIGGDKDTGVTSELLSNRISGEYINFNDVLYRIVGTEEIKGQKLTKITMADYSLNKNTLTTSLAFGADASQRIFSPTYGIGLYLEEWYQADSTSETYATTYIKDNYKAMIATSGENGDNVVWYTGPTTGTGYDYTLAKTGTPVSATIGLGYYGEMFSSQFGDGFRSSKNTWLMTIYSSSYVWYVGGDGTASYRSPTYSYGVRASMYLKSDVKIVSGNGQPTSPYQITQ